MLQKIAIDSSISQCNAIILNSLDEQLLKCDCAQITEASVRQATKSLAILAYQLHSQCQQLSEQLQPNQQTCRNHPNESNKNSWQNIKLLAQLRHNPVNVTEKAIVWAKEVLTKSDSVANIHLVAQNLEELAFLLWQHHSLPRSCSIYLDFPADLADETDTRVDLAGGWSDTPPITYQCLQPKPAVLNVAVRVDKQKPIECCCSWLNYADFKGIYIFLDSSKPGQRIIIHYTSAKQVYENCCLPSQPGSLICAIVIASGLVLKQGIKRKYVDVLLILKARPELYCLRCIPHSHTGLVWALAVFCQTVLKIEQLHTTGGGWQDQVGGLIPSVELANKFEERLALVYTGTTRLAKNLLQQVVLSWLRGHFPVAQLEQYNKLKKAFASNTETVLVKQLRQQLSQLELATVSWVAGAGGGGFLYVLLAEHISIDDLREFLKSHKDYCDLTVSCVTIDYNPLEIGCV
uniref:GHMP kinase C-terminal domain-containing protein n=1 Tax=Ditylenchus dipsaci TaxID=166011 RepID=A0A915D9V3_9BILA